MSTVDPNWPDPESDGWTWRKIDVKCGHCGAISQLHEQRPEQLAVGVLWECTRCGGKNRLGGHDDPGPGSAFVLECGDCHRTFDPANVDVDASGAWTCACGVVNRDVRAAETATVNDQGATA